MTLYNMTFTVFLVDPRPFDELHTLLDELFGGCFAEDLEARASGMFRYTNQVFGLTISCLHAERWAEGQVYRLVGGNDVHCRFDTSETQDITFHVLHLLDHGEFARLMTFDEFRSESTRRQTQG